MLGLLCGVLAAQEVSVDLRNPTFADGVLTTEEGGVLTGPGIRIQARRIQYSRCQRGGESVHSLSAQGDLILEYGRSVFVGDQLDYDFETRTGCLYKGRAAVGAWYAGGQCVELMADGSFLIREGFLTTCESREHVWQFQAKTVQIYPSGFIRAERVGVSVLQTPIFWLPSFQTRIDSLRDSPLRFRFQLGGPTGSVLGMRYRFLDRGAFRAYARLEYFIARGPGAGIETDYCPADRCTKLRTQSYIARDRLVSDDANKWRYRVAGLYSDQWLGGRYSACASVDWLSDEEMPSDYRSDDFNLRTARRSHATLQRFTSNCVGRLWTTPRLNTFQTINQRLPEARLSFRTRELGRTGILYESRLVASYLNYVFARDTTTPIDLARGFQSGRLEFGGALYRPFRLGALSVRPELGVNAIGYSNSRGGDGQWLVVGHAECDSRLRFSKWFSSSLCHVVEPYLNYTYYTRPTVAASVYPTPFASPLPPGHFLFSFEDGYTELNCFRLGVRQLFYERGDCPFQKVIWDTFAYAFLHNPHIPGTVPRLYSDLTVQPTCRVTARARGAWNFPHRQLDHLSAALDWTLSENVALSLEYRFRSRFAWRKADLHSFFPDTFHSEATLLASGMSNRHHTFLTHAFFRVTPLVSVELESRHSWGRLLGNQRESNYNEYKISLEALLGCRWILKTYFAHEQFDNRFGLNLSLGSTCNQCPPGRRGAVW